MSVEAVQAGVYTAALILCVLFASLAARSHFAKRHYLSAFFVAEAFGVFCEWQLLESQSQIRWLWLSLLMTNAFWTAPCLWHFARSYSPRTQVNTSMGLQAWEIMLLIAGAVLCIPLFLASDLVQIARPPGGWLRESIHPTMVLCIGLFSVQVIIYWNKTLGLFRAEQNTLKSLYASPAQPVLQMFRVLLTLVLINWLASLARTINVWFLNDSGTVALAAVLSEYVVMLAGFFFLFHGNFPGPATPPQEEADESIINELGDRDYGADNQEIADQSNNKPDKYVKASLSEAVVQRIVDKLSDREKILPLISDNGISLDKLSTTLGEKSYYISQVLNQQLNTTFYDYVNELRIKEVCRRLVAKRQEKIFDIAQSLGFNSKSTFNTAFKAKKGMTPSAYRAQQIASADQ